MGMVYHNERSGLGIVYGEVFWLFAAMQHMHMYALQYACISVCKRVTLRLQYTSLIAFSLHLYSENSLKDIFNIVKYVTLQYVQDPQYFKL